MKLFAMVASLFLMTTAVQATEVPSVKSPALSTSYLENDWVMVIVFDAIGHNGNRSAGGGVTITGFKTRSQCVNQVDFVKKRGTTQDAYCIQVN